MEPFEEDFLRKTKNRFLLNQKFLEVSRDTHSSNIFSVIRLPLSEIHIVMKLTVKTNKNEKKKTFTLSKKNIQKNYKRINETVASSTTERNTQNKELTFAYCHDFKSNQ